VSALILRAWRFVIRSAIVYLLRSDGGRLTNSLGLDHPAGGLALFVRETTLTRVFIRVFSQPFCISMASSYPMMVSKSSDSPLERARQAGLRVLAATPKHKTPAFRFLTSNLRMAAG
jgi:hypothetical protein